MTSEIDSDAADLQRIELSVVGMTCASCSARVKKKRNKRDVASTIDNNATEKSRGFYPAPLSTADQISTVEKAGYTARTIDAPHARVAGAGGAQPAGTTDAGSSTEPAAAHSGPQAASNGAPGASAEAPAGSASATPASHSATGPNATPQVSSGASAQAPAPADDPIEQAKAAELQALGRRTLISAALSIPVILLAMIPPLQFTYWQWLSLTLAAPVVV